MSRRTRRALVAVVAALSLAVAVAPASAGELDQQAAPIDITKPPEGFGGDSMWAQSFTAGMSGGLDQVDLGVHRDGGSGPLTVQIREMARVDQRQVFLVEPPVALEAGASEALAQTFTAGLSGQLPRVDLGVYRVGVAAGPLTVEIRDVSAGSLGSPGSTVLASATVPASEVSTSPVVEHEFLGVSFAEPVAVVAGTKYAIVAYAAGGSGYAWGAGGYSNGRPFFSPSSPPNEIWSSDPPPVSGFAFKTYVEQEGDAAARTPGPTVLASTTVPASEVPTSFGEFFSVPFASPASVVAGTRYAIVAYAAAGTSYGWALDGGFPRYTRGTKFFSFSSPEAAAIWDFAGDGLAFRTYVLQDYDFTGFFSPVNNPTDPDLNSVKAGASVPVKFSLGGDQGLDVVAEGYPKLDFSSCDPSDDADPVVTTTANNGLTYDAATDTYTYVWKTAKGWKGKCGTFTLKLDDGTEHTADFQFK